MSEESPAVKALLGYSQADMDGIIVTVSRQAIHEVLDELATLRTRAETAEAELAEITAEGQNAADLWLASEERRMAAEAERDAMRAVVEAAREWAKPGPTNDQLQAREDALREALTTKEG